MWIKLRDIAYSEVHLQLFAIIVLPLYKSIVFNWPSQSLEDIKLLVALNISLIVYSIVVLIHFLQNHYCIFFTKEVGILGQVAIENNVCSVAAISKDTSDQETLIKKKILSLTRISPESWMRIQSRCTNAQTRNNVLSAIKIFVPWYLAQQLQTIAPKLSSKCKDKVIYGNILQELQELQDCRYCNY